MRTMPDRWRGKLPIPKHTHPLVQRFFVLLNRQRTTLSEVAERLPMRRGTLSEWRYRRMPRVDNLDAALNVLGYELKIVRKRDEGETAA